MTEGAKRTQYILNHYREKPLSDIEVCDYIIALAKIVLYENGGKDIKFKKEEREIRNDNNERN